MEEIELNDNDQKLLAYCYNRRRFISEIARHIGIDVKNVSVRVNKLLKAGFVIVEKPPVGNKKYVRTKSGNKTQKYFIELLKELKKRGGEIRQEEFLSLLPFNFKEEDQDSFSAPLKLLYTSPKLVERFVRITPDGERLLKEYLSKKS